MSRRLIFFGGARERNNDGAIRHTGINSNRTFQLAADNVSRSYSDFQRHGEIIRISSAEMMVRQINSEEEASISSMDVLCHGSPVTLNFSRADNLNCGFFVDEGVRTIVNLVASTRANINAFGSGSASLSSIHFQNFTNEGRIEFHGCNAANLNDTDFPPTIRSLAAARTLVKIVSENLFTAGRNKAYVIGHATSIGPHSGNQTDYRHGRRLVFHNGRILFETRHSGHLSHENAQARM